MSAFANIVANDGETTPVAHTFVPNGITPDGITWWINRNASVPAASEILSLMMRNSPAKPEDYSTPGRKVAPRRVEMSLKYPCTYVDSGTGLTLVDYVDEIHVRALMHPRSSEQRCENLHTIMQNAFFVSQILKAFQLHERVY